MVVSVTGCLLIVTISAAASADGPGQTSIVSLRAFSVEPD